MADNGPVTGQPEDDRRRFIRLRVAPLRAIDGVAALGRDCHRTVSGIDGAVLAMCVAHADLVQAHARWPYFAARALTCGVRAVFAFPIQVATVYAEAATVLLRAAASFDDAGQASMCLPRDAGEVQQAVGVVMQHATVDAATALHRLRVYAHHSRRPMRDVVAEVRTDHLAFNPRTPT